MLEEKLARARKLIEEREKIDTELSAMLGLVAPSKRGRPRKEAGSGARVEEPPAEQFTDPLASGQ